MFSPVSCALMAQKQGRAKWFQLLPFLHNPGPHMTVGECLVAFCGHCPFRRYGAACGAQSNYAWNMQVYTGELGKQNKAVT